MPVKGTTLTNKQEIASPKKQMEGLKDSLQTRAFEVNAEGNQKPIKGDYKNNLLKNIYQDPKVAKGFYQATGDMSMGILNQSPTKLQNNTGICIKAKSKIL